MKKWETVLLVSDTFCYFCNEKERQQSTFEDDH